MKTYLIVQIILSATTALMTTVFTVAENRPTKGKTVTNLLNIFMSIGWLVWSAILLAGL